MKLTLPTLEFSRLFFHLCLTPLKRDVMRAANVGLTKHQSLSSTEETNLGVVIDFPRMEEG